MALAAQTNDVIGTGPDKGNPGPAMEREMKDWLRTTYSNYGLTIDESKKLRAHNQYKFLAAEPDGILTDAAGNRVLLECKYTTKSNPDFLNGDQIKQTHDYYYQIVGMLMILNLDLCWLVVKINNNTPFRVDVWRNNQFFNHEMLPQLHRFYFGAMLPERVCPLIPSGEGRHSIIEEYVEKFEWVRIGHNTSDRDKICCIQ